MDEAEALRRRLYRPDASEEDRARYARLTGTTEPEPDASPARTRRRVPRGAVAVAVAVVLALGAAVLVVRSIGVPAPASAQLAAAPTPTPRATLRSSRVAVSIDGLPTTGQRVAGTGSAEVVLDLGDATSEGRFTVLLSSADERPVGWRAVTLVTRRDWTSYRRVMAAGPARDRMDATRPDTASAAGSLPMWVDVQAPADAAWSLTVAFDDGHAAVLH